MAKRFALCGKGIAMGNAIDEVKREAVSDHDENDEVLWMETEEALLRDDVPNLTKELIRCALSGAKGLVPIPYQGNPKNGAERAL